MGNENVVKKDNAGEETPPIVVQGQTARGEDRVKAINEHVDARIVEVTGRSQKDWDALNKELESMKEERRILISRARVDDSRANGMIPKAYYNANAAIMEKDPHKGCGFVFGRIARAIALGGLAKHLDNGQETDPRVYLKKWDDGDTGVADIYEMMVGKQAEHQATHKALSTAILADGAALIPEQIMMELIPLLEATAVTMDLGVNAITLSNAMQLRIPRELTGASHTWTEENVETNASQPSLEDMSFVLHKLAVTVPLSIEFLLTAGAMADRWVRNRIMQAASLAIDLALLRGTGTGSQPRGLRYHVASANVAARTQAGATSTLDEIHGDLINMQEDVEGSNVAFGRTGYVAPSRTFNGLRRLRDGNSNLVYDDALTRGNLAGHPYKKSNQIPQNLGGGSDETELYFASWDKMIVVLSELGGLRVGRDVTYRDSSGNLVSGFSADQVVMRFIDYVDSDLEHAEAGSVRTAVDWGV